MAQLNLTRITHYARHEDPVTGEVRQQLVEHSPTISLKEGTEPAMWIQNGRIFGEDGYELAWDDCPAWFHTQVAAHSDQALAVVKFRDPRRPEPPREQLRRSLNDLSDAEVQALLDQVQSPVRSGREAA